MSSNSPAELGDLLTAASLLLTILSLIYALWHAEIAQALDLEVPDHLEDAGPQRRKAEEVLKGRAAPLAAMSLIVAVVFLPEAIRRANRFVDRVEQVGFVDAVEQYDPVQVSLVLVVTAMAALAAYTTSLAVRLWRLKRRLKAPR